MGRETDFLVDTATSRLLLDEDSTITMKDKALVQGILNLVNKSVVPKNLSDFYYGMYDGSVAELQSFLMYGRLDNPEGLPTLYSGNTNIDNTQVIDLLKSIHTEASDVTLSYVDYSVAKGNYAYVLPVLEHTLGFTPTSNIGYVMINDWVYRIADYDFRDMVITREVYNSAAYTYETVVETNSPGINITFNPVDTYDVVETTTTDIVVEDTIKTTTVTVTHTYSSNNTDFIENKLISSDTTSSTIPAGSEESRTTITSETTSRTVSTPSVKSLLGRNQFNIVAGHYDRSGNFIPQALETDSNPNIINIVRYSDICYQIQYALIGTSTPKTEHNFVYFPTRGQLTLYPTNYVVQPSTQLLPVPTAQSQVEDLYPIFILRQNHFGLQDYNVASKEISYTGSEYQVWVHKPSSITEERYNKMSYILGRLGLPLDDILNAISENPDERYISDAFMVLGFSPSDEQAIIPKLLYLTLDFWYTSIQFTPHQNQYTLGYDFLWQDGNFNSRIKVESLTRAVIQGKVTTVGGYTKVIQENSRTYESGTDSDGDIKYTTEYWKEIYVYYQETDDYYIQLYAKNLTVETDVYSSRFDSTLEELHENTLILPLLPRVVNQLEMMEQYDALEASLRIIFYTAIAYTYYVKWYETGVFKAIITVLQLTIAVIGFVTGQIWLGVSILGGLITTALISELSDINSKLGKIFNIVVQAINVFVSAMTLNITGLIATCAELVSLATDVTSFYLDRQYEDLLEQKQTFEDFYASKLEELNAVSEKYATGSSLIDLDFLVKQINEPAQTSYTFDEYYNLTFNTLTNYDLLFTGNYSSMVTDFHTNNLRLNKGI